MDRGALQNALEVRRWLGIVAVGGNKVGELVIDVVQNLATQRLELDTTGAQHGDSVLILGQRQQQMLERGIFVGARWRRREPDGATFRDCATTLSPPGSFANERSSSIRA